MTQIKRFLFALTLLAAGAFLVEDAHAGKYKIDTVHSSVTFKIRHFLSKTTGRFTKFSGKIHFDAKKPKATKIDVVINVDSINTDNKSRDGHLKKPEFFNAAKFSKITFKSTKITDVQRKGKKVHMTVVGNLTIKGKTLPVKLKTVFLGEMTAGRFGTRAGFSATTKINRHKFGVSTGKKHMRLALGANVSIDINIEAIKLK